MDVRSFSDGAMLRHGWEKTQSHLGFLLGSTLIAGLITIAPFILAAVVKNGFVSFLAFLAYIFLGLLMMIGLIRIMIAVSDGKKAELNMLFKGMDVFLPFLGVMFLLGLILMVGFFLFVIPGIIWSLKYGFAPILVIDQKMDPMEALKKSAEMTNGLKWDLLGFNYVTGAVNMLGMLALYVGMIVTIPITMLAKVAVYRQLGPKSTKA